MSGRVLIIAEKPSAARRFADALGGASGTYGGERYEVFALAGHLLEFVEPHQMVAADKSERYRSWNPDNLPWDPRDMSWERSPRDDGKAEVCERLRKAIGDAAEVCIATDVDPSGEGELIAWEALDRVGWSGRTTRMYFADEEVATIRAAFPARIELAGGMEADGDWRMAEARSRFDFLSMQLTRAATAVARGRGARFVCRQGRLKTVMVALVGDQLEAIANYRRKPYYEAQFKDEHDHAFAKEDAERHDRAEDVDLSALGESGVTVDEVVRRHKAPPRLPDLAELSAELSERGFGPKEVLSTYQSMYEDGILSYPRTEDKCVTAEQFEALLPLTDAIAALVGVDAAALTHRAPRPTHVKPGGAHGANRPGQKVPDDMGSLARYGKCAADIYAYVARAWLATLAEDYAYDRHFAHVTDYPDYKGRVDVPVSGGWTSVFGKEPTGVPFGERAVPYVHEGANKKPPKPTTKWLARQLKKHDVGTGATRTSVLADAESGGAKALLAETKGVLSLTPCGKVSHALTKGTKIASVEVTESLFAAMREVRDGRREISEIEAEMAPIVMADLAVMRENAEGLEVVGAEPLGPCPRCGAAVTRRDGGSVQCTSNRFEKDGDSWRQVKGCGWSMGAASVYGQKRLTDRQVSAMLAGKSVTLSLKSKAGKPYKVRVRSSAEDKFGMSIEFADDGGARKGGLGGKGRR